MLAYRRSNFVTLIKILLLSSLLFKVHILKRACRMNSRDDAEVVCASVFDMRGHFVLAQRTCSCGFHMRCSIVGLQSRIDQSNWLKIGR